MKKSNIQKQKPNTLLILILTVIVVGFFALSLLLSDSSSKAIISELPDSYENLINKLVISEVMTKNTGVYVNENAEIADYVEIYNGTSKTINLDGYGLSDRKDKIKWAFSNVTIAPGEYLVVALTGKLEEGNNASFKLSAKGGENIILTNPSGKVIDALETVSLSSNQAMIRDNDGSWKVVECGTPGFENSQEGFNAYSQSLLATNQINELVINEFLPKNKGNYINDSGKQESYVEVKNISNHTVNLSEYSLSCSLQVPFIYQLPEVNLQPGEVYLLIASNKQTVENYTGFTLVNNDGVLLLSHQGKIIEKIEYNNLENGYAYIRNEDGSSNYSSIISPGYDNTNDGVNEFASKYHSNKQDLIINEVMNNNTSYLAQNGGEFYDWIELYNNSNHELQLSDYYLSTNDNSLLKFQLPEVVIPAGGYYIIMCSGDSNLTNKSYTHAPFKISDVESIYLSTKKSIVDCVFVADVPVNYSYGRNASDGFYYIATPTPNKANEKGNHCISMTPSITTISGAYNNVQTLEVNIIGQGTIYYTLDGSRPTASSKVYNGPIVLSKTTVVNAMCVENGKISSQIATSTYLINENHTLPVLSISINNNDLTVVKNTPYTTIEKQAIAQLFDEKGGFIIPCSFALFGGNSRYSVKQSYALRFDSKWGASSLNYPLFDSRDCSNYDAIVLRSGSDDWQEAIMRDVLGTSLVDEYTDLDVQAYKTCILYINGKYQGIYNIREKVNGKFISDHYNVNSDGANIFRIDGVITTGSDSAYKELSNYVKNNSMKIASNYAYVASKLNMTSTCDFWIAEMYVGNRDVLNVRLFSHPEVDEGKWNYILFDLDRGFETRGSTFNYYTEYLANPNGMQGFTKLFDNNIPRKLFDNDEFVALWLERLNYNLRNTFETTNVLNRLNELTNSISKEIERDRAHWDGASMAKYNSQVQMIKDFVNKRTKQVLQDTKSFFKLTDAEMKEYFGDLW